MNSPIRAELTGLDVFTGTTTAGTVRNDVYLGTAAAESFAGNSGDDLMDGGAGNDTLNGDSGNDMLAGGLGNDSLNGGAGNNTYVFGRGDGVDTVATFLDNTAGKLNTLRLGSGITADQITLKQVYGSTFGWNSDLEVSIVGTTDKITFSGGWRGLYGAAYNDYATLQRIEFANGTVWDMNAMRQKLFAGTAGADVYSGTIGDDTLFGLAGADTIRGDNGNDFIDGGADNDSLSGGAGNDTYLVDSTLDVITDLANEGTDTVQSSVAWTLGTNTENLTLTGTSLVNGTGNALANQLVGNSAANVLTGNAGDDSLNGAAGADVLAGGDGHDRYVGGLGSDSLTDTSTVSNDIYVWGRGEGADTLADSGGTDRLDILAGVTEDQVWLRRIGNNLELSVIGTSDSMTINGWYTSAANQVESFKLADGQALLASQVQQLVDAMASFAPPAAGQTTLPANYQTALNPVIAPSWA